MKKIKITKWGTNKLQCIKAIKYLIDLPLREAKVVVESKMPYVIEVCGNGKLETFVNYTKDYCSDMEYTIEDSVPMARTNLVEGFTSALNNAHAAFNVLIEQNDEIGGRYNKVCAEANLLQAEVEKLKANNNNDLCIQLREEIACLKRDNGVLKESNNTFVETIRDQEKQIRDLEKEKNTLREGKKVVEANNDSLMIANKSLQEDVQRLKEILQAIKNLAL